MHYLSLNLIFTSLLFGCGFRTVKSAASSMEPQISIGDKFVVDERYYRHYPPDRLDLVMIRRPDGLVVKRIIGIGGDIVAGKDRKILLNGQVQEEPFILHKFRAGVSPDLDTFEAVSIPAGKYFVMGDNRDVSLDSRTPSFGLVDARVIVGKPLYGYHIVDKPLWWKLN